MTIDTFFPAEMPISIMRVRNWQDIVRDVVDADVEPNEWRAVAGPRESGLGEDMYLGHPRRGVYLLKTYPKNPFDVRGVGTQVARSIDDELGSYLPEETNARFGVRSGAADEDEAKQRATRLQETVRTHADAPTTPDALFEDVMEAIESPAFGPLSFEPQRRPEPIQSLSGTFDEAEHVLNAELDDLIDEDEVSRGFD